MNDCCDPTEAVVGDLPGRLHLRHPAGAGKRGDLNVVLVFDSAASRFRGLDIGRRLPAGLPGEHDLSCHLWSSQLLVSAQFASVASQQAVEADLVILALEGDSGLPAPVGRWLEMWTRRPREKGGTLMLVVDERNLARPAWTGLRRRVSEVVDGTPLEFHSVSHKGPEPDYYNEFLRVLNRARIDVNDGLEGLVHRFENHQPLVRK